MANFRVKRYENNNQNPGYRFIIVLVAALITKYRLFPETQTSGKKNVSFALVHPFKL